MGIKTIGVIGGGECGCAIAQAALSAAYRVVLQDVLPEALKKATARIGVGLADDLASGRTSSSRMAEALASLVTVRRVEDACREGDLLIETLPDELESKLEIFTIFDKFAKPGAILASTTWSLRISDLAGITFRAEECIGMRLSRSGPKINSIEIVRAPETSMVAVETCREVARRMGFNPRLIFEEDSTLADSS
jgi:3-hydroxybutyryl-CoA dehydrogenase